MVQCNVPGDRWVLWVVGGGGQWWSLVTGHWGERGGCRSVGDGPLNGRHPRPAPSQDFDFGDGPWKPDQDKETCLFGKATKAAKAAKATGKASALLESALRGRRMPPMRLGTLKDVNNPTGRMRKRMTTSQ